MSFAQSNAEVQTQNIKSAPNYLIAYHSAMQEPTQKVLHHGPVTKATHQNYTTDGYIKCAYVW
jgi:hypothetical protein